MEEGRGAASLKVTYDGKEAIVAPGECQLIEATKIKLASAARLQEGMTLIGSYRLRQREELQDGRQPGPGRPQRVAPVTAAAGARRCRAACTGI